MTIRILLIQAFLFTVLSLQSQVNSGGQDPVNILLNERVIDRPVSLHKGQLQTNAYYVFDLFTKSYDNNSVKSDLKDRGIASAMHSCRFDINYGILEYIQVTIGMNYTSTTQRTRDQNLIIFEDYIIREYEITEIKGFEDIFIGSTLRLPINLNPVDIGFSLGITLPTAKYKSKYPEHDVQSFPGTINYFYINYHNINPAGKGVPTFLLGLKGKLSTRRMAVNIRSDYRMSNKEITNMFWQYRLDNNEFKYQSAEYSYMADDLFSLAVHIDYQAFSWFDVFAAFCSEHTFGGWSEQYGPRISNNETSLNTSYIGFEIQATPHVRLYQKAGLSVSGKNTIAPVSFKTGISYNLFPLKEF